jgi:hypothetical protein
MLWWFCFCFACFRLGFHLSWTAKARKKKWCGAISFSIPISIPKNNINPNININPNPNLNLNPNPNLNPNLYTNINLNVGRGYPWLTASQI